MSRDMLIKLVERHWPTMMDYGITCECGMCFYAAWPHDPRPDWARHLASAIYPE